MVVTFLVQPYHFQQGNILSTMNDPIALALKERLELNIFKEDLVAVGEDEIFLHKDGKSYVAHYDVEKFYDPQPQKPRTLTLKFREV
jgi:hypothetical protein